MFVWIYYYLQFICYFCQQVGPAGSQSGLLACLIVEILNIWPMLRHPYRALFKHLAIAGLLFVVGLLPWFDNFSSFFGFLFGFLLSYAILPFVSLGEYDRQKKIFMIWVCLITTVFLFLLLVLFFYVIPVYDCEFCGYFNCLPLTRDFCSAQNINFKRTDSPVWHKGARRRASPLNRIPTSILSRFEPRYLLTTPLWVDL